MKNLLLLEYTDQEVVAALNSCLDLEKWKNLPYGVKERAKALLCSHRAKPVCFFDQRGFGLRVYMDSMDVGVSSDDEVEVIEVGIPESKKKSGIVDINGYWLRCPAEVWNKRQERVPFIIMDDRGAKYYEVETFEEDDGPEDDSVWSRCDQGAQLWWRWTTLRSRAEVFTDKEKAEVVALHVGGVVVKR